METVKKLFNKVKGLADNFFDPLPDEVVIISEEFENGRPVYYNAEGEKVNVQ
jgi:hypothetical protein